MKRISNLIALFLMLVGLLLMGYVVVAVAFTGGVLLGLFMIGFLMLALGVVMAKIIEDSKE